jgi:MSHA pilin protein MshA
MVKTRDHRKGEQGFTLIEIIAVLVILGILAVVAVPKYLDLQTEARNSAAKGLIAAAQSQLSMGYAAMKLNSALDLKPSTECAKVAISDGAKSGTVTCTGEVWTADVPITAKVAGMADGEDVKGVWTSPEAATAAGGGEGEGGEGEGNI